jgi:sensor histidine kinase YesM
MKTRISYWACQILGWGLYSLAGISMIAQQVGLQPTMIAGYTLFFLYSIALTDWLRREIKKRHWLEGRPAMQVLRLSLAVIGIAAVQTFLVIAVSYWLSGSGKAFAASSAKTSTWISITAATAMWTIFYVTLTAPRRYREKEVRLQLALREAELRALEAQINPHFLFNCLNSIRALVLENPPLAQDMLTRLANILRFNLHRDLMHTIPLSSELEAVRDYLALEKVRFEERLRVEFAIEPAASVAQVPPMVLQTLVENALKHGIARLPEGGDLVIRAVLDADSLRLEVENTGQIVESKGEGKQLGLTNTRDRMRILYGDRASLELTNGGNRVTARAVIPRQV